MSNGLLLRKGRPSALPGAGSPWGLPEPRPPGVGGCGRGHVFVPLGWACYSAVAGTLPEAPARGLGWFACLSPLEQLCFQEGESPACLSPRGRTHSNTPCQTPGSRVHCSGPCEAKIRGVDPEATAGPSPGQPPHTGLWPLGAGRPRL